MKSFAAAFFLCFPALALADEASKLAKAEEMLQLLQADQSIRQVLEQMRAMIATQMSQMQITPEARPAIEEMQQKMMAMIADRMSWDKFKRAVLKIYVETYSDEDMDGIIAFYKTPAGRSLIEKMPLVMQKSMALGQQMMGDLMPEIQRMTEEMRQKYGK
jgi:uncharacterized protein